MRRDVAEVMVLLTILSVKPLNQLLDIQITNPLQFRSQPFFVECVLGKLSAALNPEQE